MNIIKLPSVMPRGVKWGARVVVSEPVIEDRVVYKRKKGSVAKRGKRQRGKNKGENHEYSHLRI